MGAILFSQSPGMPSREYSALKQMPGIPGQNLGGKFALPSEFDTNKLAGAFYQEGQESLAMQADQQVLGTSLLAPGWTVWKYPKEKATSGGNGKPEPHPLADQPHRVSGTKVGENFVLHCRSRDVQDQVNRAYADQSSDMLRSEILGETRSGESEGLVSEQYLKAQIGVDREIEESAGRSTAVHGGNPQGSRIQGRPQVISR